MQKLKFQAHSTAQKRFGTKSLENELILGIHGTLFDVAEIVVLKVIWQVSKQKSAGFSNLVIHAVRSVVKVTIFQQNVFIA